MRRSPAPRHAWTMMLVTGALLLPLASVAPAATAESAASAESADVVPARPATPTTPVTPAAPTARQQDFAAAARAYGVPEQVLLGVSYLESRWDANAGQPSTAAGYGPMHLTDVRDAVADGAAAIHDTGHGTGDGTGDARGDDGRPLAVPRQPSRTGDPAAATQTIDRAAGLTGLTPDRLRTDPAANILGGAALLAAYQRELGAPGGGTDPADWYAAVARYSGATELGAARFFADQVFATIRTGAERVTDDGQRVTLVAAPDARPDPAALSALSRLGVRATAAGAGAAAEATDCPATLSCDWLPAPYQQLSSAPGDYGNHDLGNRPAGQQIKYIVVHDTEASYDETLRLVQDPTYVSWQYTIRSQDGHVVEHVRPNDVAWQAGNWYINAKSIGIEHEGFLAQGGTWYTEAMYRSSARLVRYLAARFHVPLDRAHVLGHDNVPGTTPATVAGMHEDPGPYWDWAHYFRLLGRPLHATAAGARADMVMILPDYDRNVVPYTGCDAADPAAPCPPHGGGSIMLRTAPRADAPLVKDVGKHPQNGDSTMAVNDHGARAATGQRYAVAGRQAGWTAIWYLGQKAWFANPAGHPTAVGVRGLTVTPKPGLASVPVYGRAYPEAAAYPAGVPVQGLVPLQYTFAAGQRYTVGGSDVGEYYYATTFDTAGHAVIRGSLRYYEIQFGHRVFYVKADDVRVVPTG